VGCAAAGDSYGNASRFAIQRSPTVAPGAAPSASGWDTSQAVSGMIKRTGTFMGGKRVPGYLVIREGQAYNTSTEDTLDEEV
jgi:hypothetical protein